MQSIQSFRQDYIISTAFPVVPQSVFISPTTDLPVLRNISLYGIQEFVAMSCYHVLTLMSPLPRRDSSTRQYHKRASKRPGRPPLIWMLSQINAQLSGPPPLCFVLCHARRWQFCFWHMFVPPCGVLHWLVPGRTLLVSEQGVWAAINCADNAAYISQWHVYPHMHPWTYVGGHQIWSFLR